MSYDPKLKEAMSEIRAVLLKHDIAAYVALVSPTHSEFRVELTPTWSAAVWENQGELRLRVKQAEVGKEKAKQLIESTAHMFCQLRDLVALAFKQFDSTIEKMEEQIKIEHTGYNDFEPHNEH